MLIKHGGEFVIHPTSGKQIPGTRFYPPGKQLKAKTGKYFNAEFVDCPIAGKTSIDNDYG